MSDSMTSLAVDKLLDTGRTLHDPIEHPAGGKAIVTPEGYQVHRLQPTDDPLTHIKQQVSVLDSASLIAYVNRFKGTGDKTTIFADYRRPIIKATIDYHDKDKADYLHHAVTFTPPWSEQWDRWRGIDGKAMNQVAFAEFIEENMGDIVTPDGSVFLDLVTGLHAKKKVTFESGIRLHDGSNQLTFQEEVEAKGRGSMTVPAEFEIGVPIFFGGAGYKVRCFLRYRIDDGKLLFTVKIHRRLFTEQTAFADITKEIAEAVSLKVLNGSA